MPTGLKILSDFDGVWTDQQLEAAAVRDFAVDALAQATGRARVRVAADYDALVTEVTSAPAEHGWAPDGRISAYVDEDPLCQCSAVCRLIDRAAGETTRHYRAAVLGAGFGDMGAFGEHCFHGGSSRFRDEHPACIVPQAREMLAALHAAGAEVVVASNSATEKLVAFFAHAGIGAGEQPDAELRVRGSAAKWFLGASDAKIEIGGRTVFVDRPRYRDVIAREAPDVVIGDVFSLDLALPHTMRTLGDAGAPRTLVLRRHGHTPSWVLEGARGAIDATVAQVGDLVDVLARSG